MDRQMDMPYTESQRELLREIFGTAGLFKIEREFGIEWDARLAPATKDTGNLSIDEAKTPVCSPPEQENQPQTAKGFSIDEGPEWLDLEGLEMLTKKQIVETVFPDLPHIPGEPAPETITVRTLENWIAKGFFPAADVKSREPHRWHASTIQRWNKLRGNLRYADWDKQSFLELGKGWPANPRE